MLTLEQVAETRKRHELATGDKCFGHRHAQSLADIPLLLRDRAEIAQELEDALRRKAELGYSTTKALTALIERIGK